MEFEVIETYDQDSLLDGLMEVKVKYGSFDEALTEE